MNTITLTGSASLYTGTDCFWPVPRRLSRRRKRVLKRVMQPNMDRLPSINKRMVWGIDMRRQWSYTAVEVYEDKRGKLRISRPQRWGIEPL